VEELLMAFFERLKQGLEKTRKGIVERIDSVSNVFKRIDEDLFDEIEEILITSDIGVNTTNKIINELRETVKKNKIENPAEIKKLLKKIISDLLGDSNREFDVSSTPAVITIVGVNGVGKTTSIGKIANSYVKEGKKVLIAAADTFRAAAIDQLDIWAKRAHADIIKNKEGTDPTAIIFDAINAAKARKTDILICDTAGRLHTKKNLMNELEKMHRIINRELPDSSKQTLLVLDATTGQNAITQAKMFNEISSIDGIILTKLDGTAKGGIVIAIMADLKIPVKYICIGEQIDDLKPFIKDEFINALFD
jgi:fused signal recognition particle receptor